MWWCWWWRLVLLLGAQNATSHAYKMLVFVPDLSNSQIQFCSRVAETLANGGHDVTMLFVTHFEDSEVYVKIPKGVRTHRVNGVVAGYSKKELEKEQAKLIFKDQSAFDPAMFQMIRRFNSLLTEGCRMVLKDKGFLRWLREEQFDIAYAYIYSTCPIGLIHHARIASWVWLNSGPLMDYVAHATGVPIIPSYVPPVMMEATDEMTFYERIKSFVGHLIGVIIIRPMKSNVETEIFREELNDPNFPNTLDIGAKCPLIMVNTNELYDLPRPTLAKVVNIGGLGVGFDSAKPLETKFQKIVDSGKSTIIFSFGSVAAAHEMPAHWKSSLLSAFASFPDVQFIMRYVGDDLNERLPSNVHTSEWIPQKDLLLEERTRGFITHGGYNSIQEAISAGVPLITIPLFGDQPKNSKIAQKYGFAINIPKNTLNKETLIDALDKILTDQSYSRNIKRLSSMVRKQPVKSSERLLKWSEFLAEFKDLQTLEPYGIHLNFIQYFSLDVLFFLSFIAIVFVYIFFKIIQFLGRKCFKRQTKFKND